MYILYGARARFPIPSSLISMVEMTVTPFSPIPDAIRTKEPRACSHVCNRAEGSNSYFKLDATQDQMARIRTCTNRCALHTPDGKFQHWVLYPPPGSGAEKRPLPHTPGWSCRAGKESDHLFATRNRGQLEGVARRHGSAGYW